jgi:hypothetical protein
MSIQKEENLEAKKEKTKKNLNDFFNIESDEEENEDDEKASELENKIKKWFKIFR